MTLLTFLHTILWASFYYWYLGRLFPAKPGMSKKRLFWSIVVCLIYSIFHRATAWLPKTVPVFILVYIVFAIHMVYRLYFFWRFTDAPYSQYLLATTLLSTVNASVWQVLTAMISQVTLSTYNWISIYLEFLDVFISILLLLYLNPALVNRSSSQIPGMLRFLACFIITCFAYSLTTLAAALVKALPYEKVNIPLAVLIFIIGITAVVGILYLGIYRYQKWLKQKLSVQLEKYELHLAKSNETVQRHNEEIRKLRHDQINLTSTIQFLIQNQETAEALQLLGQLQEGAEK